MSLHVFRSSRPTPAAIRAAAIRPLLLALSMTLSGCAAVGPDFQRPAAPGISRYTDAPLPAKTAATAGEGGAAQTFIDGRAIPAQWWQVFHSPALNALIERGLAHNATLEASQAALREAQENLRAEIGSAYYPSVTGSVGVERERASSAAFGISGAGASEFTLYNPSLNISYTLDIFGGARREVEALRAQVDYARFEIEASRLTLAANIVTSAITQASLRAQIQATRELVTSQEDQLKVVQTQFDLGGAAGSDVLTQKTQLAQTRAKLPPLETQLAQSRDALATLLGVPPEQGNLPDFDLAGLQLPAELPLSVPAELVRQRPDVRASEALLHQASAQIGVATANQFPSLSLSGSLGSTATKAGDLFSSGTAVWSIGANLLGPIFNGGSLSAKRRAAVAAYDQVAAQYRQTVLQSYQNVADTLRALEGDALSLQAQTDAEQAARDSLSLTESQYKLGGVSYLLLLNAQRQYQEARISRIQAQASRYADSAALFQALGGGWWNLPDHATDTAATP